MTMQGTEQETTQTLESILKDPSVEEAEVSEEATTEEVKGTTEETEKEAEAETKALGKPDKELQAKIQAEADKRVQSYRQTREADTALIRRLQTENIDLKKQSRTKGDERKLASLLSGDEENGITPDESKNRETVIREFLQREKDYLGKSGEVEDVASLATLMAEKMDKQVATQFDLFDSNPTVRAKGAVSLITDAVHFINEREAFNRILDEIPLLSKGSEVRQQIDSFVIKYMELSDKKGKDLLINQLRQEFKVTPRKKPATPSDGGGIDFDKLTPREKIDAGIAKIKNKIGG